MMKGDRRGGGGRQRRSEGSSGGGEKGWRDVWSPRERRGGQPRTWCDYHWFTGRTNLHCSLHNCYHWADRREVGRLFTLNLNSIRQNNEQSCDLEPGNPVQSGRRSWMCLCVLSFVGQAWAESLMALGTGTKRVCLSTYIPASSRHSGGNRDEGKDCRSDSAPAATMWWFKNLWDRLFILLLNTLHNLSPGETLRLCLITQNNTREDTMNPATSGRQFIFVKISKN